MRRENDPVPKWLRPQSRLGGGGKRLARPDKPHRKGRSRPPGEATLIIAKSKPVKLLVPILTDWT
jgi:hypothetical protein